MWNNFLLQQSSVKLKCIGQMYRQQPDGVGSYIGHDVFRIRRVFNKVAQLYSLIRKIQNKNMAPVQCMQFLPRPDLPDKNFQKRYGA